MFPSKASTFLKVIGQPEFSDQVFDVSNGIGIDMPNHYSFTQGNPSVVFEADRSGFKGSGSMKTLSAQSDISLDHSVLTYPIKANKSGLYNLFIRALTNESSISIDIFINGKVVQTVHENGVQQNTWIWVNTSFVIPDDQPLNLGISPKDENISLDIMYIGPSSLPDTVDFSTAYITVHAKVFEFDEQTSELTDSLPIYDAKVFGKDIISDGWINFSLKPLPGETVSQDQSKYVLTVFESGSSNAYYVIWDEADSNVIDDPYLDSSALSYDNDNNEWDILSSIDSLALQTWNFKDSIQDDCTILTPKSEEQTLNQDKFDSNSLNPVFVNTSITDDTGDTNNVQLDLPDRLVNLLIDQSGSMTWNDAGGLRHDLALRLIDKLESTYPGGLAYNIFSFESTPLRVNLFAVIESDDVNTDSISDVAESFFAEQESNFAGVRVVRKENAPPQNAIDGEIVTEGFIDRAFDDNLDEGQDYFYKVFTFDGSGRFSDGIDLEAVPRIRDLPTGIGQFSGNMLKGSGYRRDSGSVLLHHMDEQVGSIIYDFSDNQLHGEFFGSEDPFWLNQIDVPNGRSGLRFDGNNDYIRVDDYNSVLSSFDSGMTFMCWVNPFDTDTQDIKTLFIREDTSNLSSNNNKYDYWASLSGDVVFFTRDNKQFATSEAVIEANTWNHIAFVVNENGDDVQIYINGVNRTVSSNLDTDAEFHDSDSSNYFKVGNAGFASLGASGVIGLHGKLTELSVHQRQLSIAEISSASFMPSMENEKILDNGDRLLLLNYTIPSDFDFAGGKVRILRKEESGPAVFDFTGNTNDQGEPEMEFEGFGFEPFHENDGTIIYEESASAGAFTIAIPDDYIHGRKYNYRIFSQNAIGNFSIYNDSPNISIEVPSIAADIGENALGRVVGLPVPALQSVAGVDVQAGNRKNYLQWQPITSDDRIKEIHVYYSGSDFPIADETEVTGELVFRGDPTDTGFVHRNIENSSTAYYTIISRDQFGFFSNPSFISSIPNEDADESSIPLLEVRKLRYELVNEEAISLKWDEPVRFERSVEAWFDQRIAIFAQITDEFGAPLADDSELELVADAQVVSAGLAEDVFREDPVRESFDPEAEQSFVLTSTPLGDGTVRGLLRMTSDFNIISAIEELNLSVRISFSIPDPDRADSNAFEFRSLPISIKMKNPFSMDIINLNNDIVNHVCKQLFPIGDINAIATGGLLFSPSRIKEFDGTFIRRQESFVARARIQYRGEALDRGGQVSAVVHEATDPQCDQPGSQGQSGVEFEPSFFDEQSRSVRPPATTLELQFGQEENDDGTINTFSFVDIPLSAPQFPQGVMLFVEGTSNGFLSRRKMYIVFENILRVETTVDAPSPDCIDVAEQFASVYLIDPDSSDPLNPETNPVPDGEICKWNLRKGSTGEDRPFYSTDNVPSRGEGVFSTIQNGLARQVFFGPACGVTWTIVNLGQDGGVALVPEVYSIKATVVYDGLSSFEDRPAFIRPQQASESFGSRFLMNLNSYREQMWADGFDFEQLTIWHKPNTAGGWAASAFRACANQFGGLLFILNAGQTVELETGNDFEIFYGDDVEIGFDPYIDEPTIENGTQETGFAMLPLSSTNDRTEVFLRINQFIGPPTNQRRDNGDDSGKQNICDALGLPDSLREKQNDNVLFGNTEVTFNDELRSLKGGGGLENGVPPTIIELREPLDIKILQARRNGEPVQQILVDGQSEHEFIVEVTFAQKPVPNGTPIFLTIGGPNPQKLQLNSSIIFTEQVEDPFLGGGVRSLASFTTLPFSPIEQFEVQVQAETRYDKRGDVERSMTSCLTIDYKIIQDDEEDEEDEETGPSISDVFNGQVELYDIVNDTWETKDASMNHPRGSLTLNWAFDAYGEVLYAIGGLDGTSISSVNEQYRIDSDEWVDMEPMPTPRFSHSSEEYAGHIYVLGGLTIDQGGLVVSRAVERYDPLSDSWVSLEQMPNLGIAADDMHGISLGATVQIENYIYVLCGVKNVDRNGGIEQLNTRILVYDIDTDSWSASEPLQGDDLVLYSRIAPIAYYDSVNGLIRVANGALVTGQGVNQTLEFVTDSFAVDPIHLTIQRDESSYQDFHVPRYKSNSTTVDNDTYILGGSNSQSNVLNTFERVSYNSSLDLFEILSLSKPSVARQSFGIANDETRFIFIAGGITSGRPPGFIQIDASVTPKDLRLDGRQSAGVEIELFNEVGEHPSEDIRVLVRGFLVFPNTESEDLAGGGGGSDEEQQGAAAATDRAALIYPVKFSSNDFIISNGFGSTTLLPRSEDILDKVDEIREKLQLARQGEDTEEAEEDETFVIEEGSEREPYNIKVQITIIDDFYFGQTVVDIEDNEDLDDDDDDDDDDDEQDDDEQDDDEQDDEPPTAEEDPYSPEFDNCRSFSVTSELPDQPQDDDEGGEDDTPDDGITISDSLTTGGSPVFNFAPSQQPQLESPEVNYFSDIEWIPQVVPHITNSTSDADEVRTVINRLQAAVPFGASPFLDGLSQISNVLLDENLDNYSKIIYAQTDNEESLSFASFDNALEDIQAIDGFAEVPVILNNFSVVFPTTLSAILARTDTSDLEEIVQSTGGQSQTVLDADFADEVLNNMIGRAAGSIGYGTYSATIDLGRQSIINTINLDSILFDNTDGNWTVQSSVDGFNFSEPSDQFDINEEVEFFRLSGRYLRFNVVLLSGLSASIEEEYDLVATPGRPKLTSINISYGLPKESFMFIDPDETLFSAQQIAASIQANNPPESEIEVGVASSKSTSWDDFTTEVRPGVDRNGKIFVPIRTHEENSDLNEPLISVDGFAWRAAYGAWDPESRVTIRSFSSNTNGAQIVDDSEYRLFPRNGLVVFRSKRNDSKLLIEIENSGKVRIGLRIVNRFADESVSIKGLGYMWNTNVFLPPPLSERPPSASNLQIFPQNPFIFSTISARYEFSDINRDSEDTEQTEIRWYINGSEVEFLRDLRSWNDIDNFSDPLWVFGFSFRPEDVPDGIPFEEFARDRGESILKVDDVVYFTVRPSDGSSFGDIMRSPSVTVESAPPFVTELSIIGRTSDGQEQSTVTTATTAVAKFNFFDDGGENTSTIIWFVDGNEFKRGNLNGFTNGFNNNEVIPGEVRDGVNPLSIGNVLEVEIRPSAGNTAGEPIRSEETTVENAPPVVTGVQITPLEPTSSSVLQINFNFFDNDIEQGSTTQNNQSSIRWFRQRAAESEFTEVQDVANSETVSTSFTVIGDQWRAEVVPFDGISVGETVQSNTVTIQ